MENNDAAAKVNILKIKADLLKIREGVVNILDKIERLEAVEDRINNLRLEYEFAKSILEKQRANLILNILENENSDIIGNKKAEIVENKKAEVVENKKAEIVENEKAEIVENEKAEIVENKKAEVVENKIPEKLEKLKMEKEAAATRFNSIQREISDRELEAIHNMVKIKFNN